MSQSVMDAYAACPFLMDGLRQQHTTFRTRFQEEVLKKSRAAAAYVKNLMGIGMRANRNLGGLRIAHCIPNEVMAAWAAKFKEQDENAGIYHTTGWECWQPGSDFYEWFKKHNPEFFPIEEKSGNSIIVPASKYERIIVAKPQAQPRIVAKAPRGPAIIVSKGGAA
jgi:hypothetical protein